MELIKNVSSRDFCLACNNRGRTKIVQACDREKFDREFDRLDAPGTMSMDLVFEKAMEGCKFDYYYCPFCERGQKYKNEYPMYKAFSYMAERDALYEDLLKYKLELQNAEEKEIQIMKMYSKEDCKALAEAEKKVDELSQKYVESRKRFINFVKQFD